MILGQISNRRQRIKLIRSMQTLGMASFLLCVLCMLALFAGQQLVGEVLFGTSLVLTMASLGVSLREIWVSSGALDLELSDIESTPESPPTQPMNRN
jgi:hypothetical protein